MALYSNMPSLLSSVRLNVRHITGIMDVRRQACDGGAVTTGPGTRRESKVWAGRRCLRTLDRKFRPTVLCQSLHFVV